MSENQGIENLSSEKSRREVVKLGGVASLSLIYAKPSISTVRSKPAFSNYGDPVRKKRSDREDREKRERENRRDRERRNRDDRNRRNRDD